MDAKTLQKITNDLIAKLKALEGAADFEDAQDAAVRAAMDELLARRGKVPQQSSVLNKELVAKLEAKNAELLAAIAKNAKLQTDIRILEVAKQNSERDLRAEKRAAIKQKNMQITALEDAMKEDQKQCEKDIEELNDEIELLQKKLREAPAPPSAIPSVVPRAPVFAEPVPDADEPFEKFMTYPRLREVNDMFERALQTKNTGAFFAYLEELFDIMLEYYAGTDNDKGDEPHVNSPFRARYIRIVLTEHAKKIVKLPANDEIRYAFEDAMAFLLVKLALGREYVRKSVAGNIQDAVKKPKQVNEIPFSTKPPNYANADNDILKSYQLSDANDTLPMTAELAGAFKTLFRLFLSENDEKEYTTNPVSLHTMYPNSFDNTLRVIDIEVPAKTNVFDLKLTSKVMAAYFAADQLKGIYLNNKDDAICMRASEILFFTMVKNNGFDRSPVNHGTASEGPVTNLFKALGRRPRYMVPGEVDPTFLKSYGKPAADYLELEMPIAKMSLVDAVASGNVAEIVASVSHAVANDKREHLATGLVAVAKAGLTEILPVFADANHMLSRDDWQAAMDAAETEEMIHGIAETGGILAKGRGFLSNIKKELQRISDKESMTMAGQFVQALLLDPAVDSWLKSDPLPVKTVLVMANMNKPVLIPYGAFVIDGKHTGKELLQRFSISDAAGIANLAESTTAFRIPKSGIIHATPERMIMKVGDVEGDVPNTFTTKFEAKSGNIVYIEGTWKNTSKAAVPSDLGDPIPASSVPIAKAISAISAAKTDDDAWFAVTGVHEWLTELQLGTAGAPSLRKLIPQAEWSAVTTQIRSALEQRQYSTADSTAWQQYESLLNRYI